MLLEKFQGNPDNSRKFWEPYKNPVPEKSQKNPSTSSIVIFRRTLVWFPEKIRDKILLILLNFWEFRCNFVRISPQDFPWNFTGISWEIFFPSYFLRFPCEFSR